MTTRAKQRPEEQDVATAAERADDAAWRERAEAVAAALREAGEALATRAPSIESLREAELQLAELRRSLEGPLRARWYEEPDDRRGSFDDLSPVRGSVNPVAPRVRVERVEREGRREIELRATLGMAYEGPPLGVHGGWVAALWDDVLGEAQRLSEYGSGMTAWIKVRYRNPTPIGRELCFRGWVHEERGRRIECRGRCTVAGSEEVLSEAEGTFVRVDFEAVESRLRAGRNGSSEG